MIKQFKKETSDFLNDKDLPIFMREAIILLVLIAISIVLYLFIKSPEVMFCITGIYLMVRVFIEILRRN